MLTAGGLDEMSYVTRLMPETSFVILDEIRRRTSEGKTNLRGINRSVLSLSGRRQAILTSRPS